MKFKFNKTRLEIDEWVLMIMCYKIKKTILRAFSISTDLSLTTLLIAFVFRNHYWNHIFSSLISSPRLLLWFDSFYFPFPCVISEMPIYYYDLSLSMQSPSYVFTLHFASSLRSFPLFILLIQFCVLLFFLFSPYSLSY